MDPWAHAWAEGAARRTAQPDLKPIDAVLGRAGRPEWPYMWIGSTTGNLTNLTVEVRKKK